MVKSKKSNLNLVAFLIIGLIIISAIGYGFLTYPKEDTRLEEKITIEKISLGGFVGDENNIAIGPHINKSNQDIYQIK